MSEYVAIVGSRGFKDMSKVSEYVRELPEGTVIVSGGARGVDSAAERAARAWGFETLIFPADWARQGRGAGFERNKIIVAHSDRLVAFWDGSSSGTRHSITLAKLAGMDVTIITEEK